MKKIIVLLCVLLLTGCSSTFAYKNASWLVYWYLDDFVELNSEQEDKFDKMFEQWMQWHKTKELPKYQAHIDDIISDIKTGDISQELIAEHRERARQHWVRARTYVADDVVMLATTLDNKQIVRLFAQLEKENVEDEERIAERRDKPEDKQLKEWLKRNKKNIRKWMGKLTTQQEEIIESYYGDFASTSEYWIEYKREYQQQLRDAFAMPERDERFKTRLRELIVDPEKYRSPSFQALIDDNANTGADYAIAMFGSASRKQIERLIDEIEEIKEDIVSMQQ